MGLRVLRQTDRQTNKQTHCTAVEIQPVFASQLMMAVAPYADVSAAAIAALVMPFVLDGAMPALASAATMS